MVKSTLFQVNGMTSTALEKFSLALYTPTNGLEILSKTNVSLTSKQNDRTTSQKFSKHQNVS